MPKKSHFLKLTGAVLLGLATLVVSAILVFLLAPYILPFFAGLLPFLVGAVLFVFVVLIVWIIIYFCAYIGVAIYYIFKPMHVETKKVGTYTVDKTKEAGKRKKGES